MWYYYILAGVVGYYVISFVLAIIEAIGRHTRDFWDV